MFLDNELLVWLCLIFPFVGTALVPVLARLGQSIRTAFAVVIGFCTAGSVLLLLPDIWMGRTEGLSYTVSWAPSIGLVFSVYIDPLSVMMAAVAGGIGSLVLLYSVKYMAGQEGLTRYYALVLLFIGSMIGLVFVDKLLVLYFFWEAVGLCSYALIGFYTKDPKAAKAGIKALVICPEPKLRPALVKGLDRLLPQHQVRQSVADIVAVSQAVLLQVAAGRKHIMGFPACGRHGVSP